ncbi:hypothetical protein L226DRAFT_567122 [Lentinus tigrinus ALCF2SS1-7]|uniref:HTH La-type RNA-binding domain-containing protein n=1 Tax=Lentinus tigrinus ALCF2SS1-6 TaxID=1328759 RepID=A0A5C2SPB8_9APHY|nr:hypothetical protein L227DRAFT_560365 [Lentinus tigrinus ALCF2SS1-6]RPD78921.1 hypothetical protein L226DRAFT_567122 [Lentinus tigrinus ALCF2SS1-7]
MVAPNQPLSWAERAKKGHNAKSQQPPPRPGSQSTSEAFPAASSSSTARPSPTVSPSIHKAPSGNGSSNARILPFNSHTSPPSSSKTAPLPSAITAPKPNGDVNHHGDSSSSGPSTTSAQKQTAAPPVNVWNIRKEQMARASMQSRPTASQSSASAPMSPPSSSQEPSPTPILPTPASTDPPASSHPAATSSTGAVPPTTNGHLAPHPNTVKYDDPFVVKPGRSPSSVNISPPAIDDKESWPEVGHTVATPPNGKEVREEDVRGHEREPSQGHGSKKSEKPKWVAVPPEELHFEGPPRTQHARQRSQNPDRNNRQMGSSSAGASSSSGHASQQQSRTHSAAGRRHTPSHAGSVSHSQAQSRTGSVHSSPRHPTIRGGGRRLPDDSSSVYGANRSLRSSNANSPATYAQPQPLPIQEFIPGGRSYAGTNFTQGSRDPPALSAIPDSAISELNPHAAYFPPPPPQFGVSPYHSPRPAGSPANNPYPLPPMPYPGPGQPGMPPIPMPGYGTPPYPMYPPYGYYGSPYMYWSPPGAPPAMSSPMTNGQPPDGVPPPTMMARPPPPGESDAVAGYRDVGFTLPPAAEVQHDIGEERGRRVRELSFGSITVGVDELGKTPSPELLTQGLGAVPEGAALGLDVSGGQAHVPAREEGTSTSQEEGAIGESKTFTVFSVGIAPGEPGPARLRSRTRTQSRGAVASVSAPAMIPSPSKEADQGDAPAEDPVVRLADAAARIIDLTDSDTKYEFGTTKQADTASGSSSGPALPVPSEVSVVEASIGPASIPVFVPQYAPPYVPPVTIPGGPVPGIPTAPSPSAYAPRQPLSAPAEDEWEVRDYGYGFGRGGPPQVYPQATAPPNDNRHYRDREERQQHYGRPRRGSYGQGGYGYERGGERGSYGGRRGRGLDGGYRGRGYGGRGYSGRGGYSGQQRQQAYVPPAQPQPEINGYYAPPMPALATYIPPPYDPYAYSTYAQPPPQPVPASNSQSVSPPVPAPQTSVGFPLDATRYWLLGQLEYYLSAQNLAQDFWLRQQMDSRGWIPISLIASFNRVRALTTEMHLVVEVLMLSSLVEVKGSHVRMRQWQQYVLPTAPVSSVPEDDATPQSPAAYDGQYAHAPVHTQEEGHYEAQQNHDGDEDEEEDVVFVM